MLATNKDKILEAGSPQHSNAKKTLEKIPYMVSEYRK